MSAPKSLPLTRSEVLLLIDLIQSHPVVFSRATNVANNQSKERAWIQIADAFNASVAEHPRKPETLRLKWDNLKKAARKRTARIRSNNLKTGGGKPDYIPPDDALDKVAVILGPSCVGFTALYGGDAVAEVVEVEANEEMEVVKEPAFTSTVSSQPFPSPPASPQSGPSQQKFLFQAATSKGKLKRDALAAELKTSQKEKNEAMTEYYKEKIKHETEIFKLKRRKLELEIIDLEKKLVP